MGSKPRGIQLPSDPAEQLAYLNYLANHPEETTRLTGRTLKDMAEDPPYWDRRKPTDPHQRGRYMADYSNPEQDQEDNYGKGLL
jgi:hypothetical protein